MTTNTNTSKGTEKYPLFRDKISESIESWKNQMTSRLEE